MTDRKGPRYVSVDGQAYTYLTIDEVKAMELEAGALADELIAWLKARCTSPTVGLLVAAALTRGLADAIEVPAAVAAEMVTEEPGVLFRQKSPKAS